MPGQPVRIEPAAPELALQHRKLVPQGEDLRLLVTVATRQQPQQRERAGDAQIRQPPDHELDHRVVINNDERG